MNLNIQQTAGDFGFGRGTHSIEGFLDILLDFRPWSQWPIRPDWTHWPVQWPQRVGRCDRGM